MDKSASPPSGVDMIYDYITGKPVMLTGAEENRQAVERFLVEEQQYAKEDVVVDEKISVQIGNDLYESCIDLVVYVSQKRFMAIKCAPGSLGSREREILAAARVAQDVPIPYAVVSDGKTAIVMETASGKKTGEILAAVYSKPDALEQIQTLRPEPLSIARRDKEALLFRSYDSMNINRQRAT